MIVITLVLYVILLLSLYHHGMDNNSVKKNIAVLRKRLGLTQQEMAEKLGISRNAYRRIESGETALVNDCLLRIASILDSTADELVLGYAPRENDGPTLNELRTRYLQESAEKERMYQEKINVLEETVRSHEKRIELLEDLVKTKEEIISMLKKEQQG